MPTSIGHRPIGHALPIEHILHSSKLSIFSQVHFLVSLYFKFNVNWNGIIDVVVFIGISMIVELLNLGSGVDYCFVFLFLLLGSTLSLSFSLEEEDFNSCQIVDFGGDVGNITPF